MRQFDAAVEAIRTYAVVRSTNGITRWYVYRRSEVKGGLLPPSSLTFFTEGRAYRACDELNAKAVIEAWRCG